MGKKMRRHYRFPKKRTYYAPPNKAANDAKRQICKTCKETGTRWNAKNLKGNPYPYYEGTAEYDETLGCKGCYQYDPVAYRKTSIKKISQEVTEDILNRLFSDEEE